MQRNVMAAIPKRIKQLKHEDDKISFEENW